MGDHFQLMIQVVGAHWIHMHCGHSHGRQGQRRRLWSPYLNGTDTYSDLLGLAETTDVQRDTLFHFDRCSHSLAVSVLRCTALK